MYRTPTPERKRKKPTDHVQPTSLKRFGVTKDHSSSTCKRLSESKISEPSKSRIRLESSKSRTCDCDDDIKTFFDTFIVYAYRLCEEMDVDNTMMAKFLMNWLFYETLLYTPDGKLFNYDCCVESLVKKDRKPCWHQSYRKRGGFLSRLNLVIKTQMSMSRTKRFMSVILTALQQSRNTSNLFRQLLLYVTNYYACAAMYFPEDSVYEIVKSESKDDLSGEETISHFVHDKSGAWVCRVFPTIMTLEHEKEDTAASVDWVEDVHLTMGSVAFPHSSTMYFEVCNIFIWTILFKPLDYLRTREGLHVETDIVKQSLTRVIVSYAIGILVSTLRSNNIPYLLYWVDSAFSKSESIRRVLRYLIYEYK